METIKWTNRFISFLVEIAMLVLLAYCGFRIGETIVLKWLLAIVLPGAVALLWGIVAAPKSRRRLKQPVRTVFKLVLFTCCAVLLYKSGKMQSGLAFGIVAILNETIAFLLDD